MRRPGPDSILRRIWWPLLGIVSAFVVGVIGYLILGFPWIDALTNTVLVLTTVGFGNSDALSGTEKIFTNAVAVLGVSAYLALLAVGVSAAAEGRFGIAARRRRMQRKAARMRGHIVLCAYGRVGRAVARELDANEAVFVVLEKQAALEEQMLEDGVVHLVGDPASEEHLERAGIARASAVISAVDSDADNVFITLTARSLNPDAFIVARSSTDVAADRLYRAGADRVISPYASSGRHMAMLAVRPHVVDYLEIRAADGTALHLEEIRIDPDSPLEGKQLADAVGAATPLFLRRASGETAAPPDPGVVLAEGDLVVLLETPEHVTRAP